MKRVLLFPFVLLLGACAGAPALPPNASLSTPIASLPLNAAFHAQNLPTPVPEAFISQADAEYAVLTNLYERLAPSVVNIEVELNDAASAFMGAVANGSGFVYDRDGHIITNAHVVADTRSILVTFEDGFVAEAELIGADNYSDLAVLRVDVDPQRLSPVTFAPPDSVRVGQRAVAIGNPFGLASSMSVGIVSGLGRQLPSAEMLTNTAVSFQNPSIIQVDAPVNPGNSGGPLLNTRGEVIGVTTAIRTESGVFEGVGFAVPASTVLRVVPDLLDDGQAQYSYIGISAESSEDGFGVPALAAPLDLPVTQGVLISSVTPGSPAALAGLRGGARQVVVRGREICAGGDIIVAVDETYVRDLDALMAYLVTETRPGDTVQMRIIRGEQTLDLPLTLQARPQESVIPPGCG